MVNCNDLPEVLMSKNRNNFVIAERELQEQLKNLDKEKIKQSNANKGMNLHFTSPCIVRVHKVTIKSAKPAMHAMLSKSEVTDE